MDWKWGKLAFTSRAALTWIQINLHLMCEVIVTQKNAAKVSNRSSEIAALLSLHSNSIREMDGGFSSILKITDLNDFITPSQECIKPVEKSKPSEVEVPSASKVRIQLEEDEAYKELRQTQAQQPKKRVEVSLTDCLACSGCITSAESVLIAEQSPDELYRILELNKTSSDTTAVVTVGVQAVLSLANKYSMEPQETAERISGLFKELGADYTTTTTVAEDLSLIESANEFITNYQNGNLPVLTGICPGWVCYGEKLHTHALSKISKVKSPQQIMGALIKLVYGPKVGRAPDQIFHITLMACFDRKLEASRKDFFYEEYKAKEVDVVITAIEIEHILDKLSKKLEDFPRVALVDLLESRSDIPLMSHPGSGSGGYAEFVMKAAANKLFNRQLDTVQWKSGRNPDVQEAVVEDDSGKAVLKFSIATGFRNIQTMVRKLKTKSSMPHFVEIMACPTGCLNGGAQVRPIMTEGSQSRDLSSKLENDYHNLPTVSKMESAEKLLHEVANDVALRSRILYTDFHAIEQQLNLGIKW